MSDGRHSEGADQLDPSAGDRWRPPTPADGLDDHLIHQAVRERLFGDRAHELAGALRIGRFVVLRKLGEGGMGVVYVAYDEQLERKVAVKLIHPQLERRGAMTRILREAQALARLSHPNVVQVHEIGEHEQSMFVAMELVVGEILRDWLKVARPWTAVIEVLIQCGRGLEAAHLAGLVHRDFKPENVIVGEDGRARVLDFGLVRARGVVVTTAVDSSDLEETLATRSASTPAPSSPDRDPGRGGEPQRDLTSRGTMLGTPAYMAPEQLRGETCDALADQFSFCVVAFEALFGERPFRGTTLEQLRANVLAGDPRPIPGDTQVPARVRAAILRGLSLAQDQRWPDMGALLAALELATGGARRRRRTWGLALSGLVGAALVAGLTLPLLLDEPGQPCAIESSALAGTWDESRREQLRAAFLATGLSSAPVMAATVEDQLDIWASRWTAAEREACEATHVAHVQSESALDRRRACLDRKRRDLDALVDLWVDADLELVTASPQLVAALPELGVCIEEQGLAWDSRTSVGPDAPADVEAARDELARARALLVVGKLDDVEAMIGALEGQATALDYPPLSLELLALSGAVSIDRGQLDDGAQILHGAIHTARERGLDEHEADMRTELARAVAGSWAKPQLEALVLAEAEAAVRRRGRRADPREIDLTIARAYLQAGAGAHEAALASFRRARQLVAEHNPIRAELLRVDIGNVLMQRGEFEAALAEYEAALPHARESFGERSLFVATLLHNLGLLASERGHPAQAREHLRLAMAIEAEIFDQDAVPIANIHLAMAEVSLQLGEPDQAVAEIEAALAVFERELGPEHDMTGAAYNGLGVLQFSLANYEASLAAYERARVAYVKVYGREHQEYALLRSNIGESLTAIGEHERALVAFAEATEVFAQTLPPDHPYQPLPIKGRGHALLAAGRAEQAVESFERALAMHERLPDDPFELADLGFGLARALVVVGRERERAHALAVQARDGFTALNLPARAGEVEQWLKVSFR